MWTRNPRNVIHLHRRVKNSSDRGLRSSPDLDLTSDNLESHIIVNVSSTLTNIFHYLVCGCIVFDCGRTDGRTFYRLY